MLNSGYYQSFTNGKPCNIDGILYEMIKTDLTYETRGYVSILFLELDNFNTNGGKLSSHHFKGS